MHVSFYDVLNGVCLITASNVLSVMAKFPLSVLSLLPTPQAWSSSAEYQACLSLLEQGCQRWCDGLLECLLHSMEEQLRETQRLARSPHLHQVSKWLVTRDNKGASYPKCMNWLWRNICSIYLIRMSLLIHDALYHILFVVHLVNSSSVRSLAVCVSWGSAQAIWWLTFLKPRYG